MKLPHFHFHRPRVDLHSAAVQTVVELTAAGLLIALLMRWFESQSL